MKKDSENQVKATAEAVDLNTGVMRHVAWGCKTCNKIDWVDSKEALAKPEHIPYRGIDLGTCSGKMIKLYAPDDDV